MSRYRSKTALLGLAAVLLGGCLTPARSVGDADAEVHGMLDQLQASVLGGRAQSVRQPEPAAPEPEPAPAPEGEPPAQAAEPVDAEGAGLADGQGPRSQDRASEAELTAPLDSGAPDALHLDLRSSLRLAVESGREFQNRRESLYLAGLSLSLTRYNFGPLLNGTVSYLWNDAEQARSQKTLGASLGVSRILPTGGSFSLGGNAAHTTLGGDPQDADPLLPGFQDAGELDPNLATGVSLDLTQPLLRGSGYLVSHEALTQAERNLVYEVREFELFREDFAIDVAQDYYDLVSQRKRIANLEQSWRDAVFDRRKSEAMRQVDRAEDKDVFGARRREIDAENTLIEARTDYKLALDDFKIALGLPTNTEVVVVDEEPPFRPVALDEASAVEVALHNRLDLMTAREQVEDVHRGLRIAEDGLRPDLGLDLHHGLAGGGDDLHGAAPDTWDSSAKIVLELPLNRQAERNAYRAALIALDRAQRDLQLQFDGVERDVRSQLRSLEQIEQQIGLQREQIAQEQRAVAVMEIRYEAGEVDSRDLLDARQSLVDAQNALIDLQVRHVIARLTLLRTLGVLFLGDDGMWIE